MKKDRMKTIRLIVFLALTGILLVACTVSNALTLSVFAQGGTPASGFETSVQLSVEAVLSLQPPSSTPTNLPSTTPTQFSSIDIERAVAATLAALTPTATPRTGPCNGQCWAYDDVARSMTWTGPLDGSEDIFQGEGVHLEMLLNGYTAILGPISVPGEIEGCGLSVNNALINPDCTTNLYPVPEISTYRIGTSNTTGFRWSPAIGYGYRDTPIEVSGSAENGTMYTCAVAGLYTAEIRGGAYSPWEEGTGAQWRSVIYVYRNREIVWKPNEFGLVQPAESDVALGIFELRGEQDTRQIAETSAVGRSSAITCNAGEYLRFVTIDERGRYSGNVGSVTVGLRRDHIIGPLRPHQSTSIGTGVFTTVTYSDGLAEVTESEIQTEHFRVQRLRLEENPDGCGISIYDVDKIWFGSAFQTTLTINDKSVGEIVTQTGKHGYIIESPLRRGDKICVTYTEPSGFQIIFGPDMYYHYDSYCFRGNC